MTPELRQREADRKPLLLAIWKPLQRDSLRSRRSTQITAAPRTQAEAD